MLDNDKIINFMGLKKIAMILSIVLVVGSIFSLATKQLSFGLDFTGGTQIELDQHLKLEALKMQLLFILVLREIF